MSDNVLTLEWTGHLVIVTLNRPEPLNALNRELTAHLHAALDEVAAQEDCRAVVLTGAGSGFCSGADVTEMAGPREGQARDAAPPEGRRLTDLAAHIRSIPQPVIAAINGIAAGAGLALALAADIRIASQKARFSCIFIKRSLAPDTGTSLMLPRLVGHGITAEMALTGAISDAPWALRVGLVNRVVPADGLMEEARAVAMEIASNPPLAVRATKRLLSADQDMREALTRESVANASIAGTEDRREAVQAFLERRQPVYKGR